MFCFCLKIVYNFFSINDKLHSHVHYEEVYQFKRLQKFSIKTLTIISLPMGPPHGLSCVLFCNRIKFPFVSKNKKQNPNQSRVDLKE